MPKRKREDGDDFAKDKGATEYSGKIAKQQERVKKKLHHGQKLLQRALKIAKGFERQKLGRRQKQAEVKVPDKNHQELARIEAEIEVVKNLDIASAAEAHIYKSILKIKKLASSPSMPQYVVDFKKPALDAATANVTARLYNSNPVKECMNPIISSIFSSLEIQRDDGPNVVEKKQKSRQHGQEKSESETSLSTRDTEEEEEDQDGSGDESEEETQALEDERIVSSSDSSVSRSASPPGLGGSKSAFFTSLSSSRAKDTSLSSDDEEEEEEEGAEGDDMLARGFGYISDSVSSASDLDKDERLTTRKNRRGQRARQQIWEKKFGSQAKHLQSSKGKRQGRDEGWDPKRGAQSAARNGKKTPGARKPPQGRKMLRHGKLVAVSNAKGSKSASEANSIALGPRPSRKQEQQQQTKPLHPSWEAAKRAKELKGASAQNGPAFHGKKVVFD